MDDEFRFTFIAGRFVKNQLRYQLESACFSRGISCEIKEQKRLMQSQFLVILSGSSRKYLKCIARTFCEWAEKEYS